MIAFINIARQLLWASLAIIAISGEASAQITPSKITVVRAQPFALIARTVVSYYDGRTIANVGTTPPLGQFLSNQHLCAWNLVDWNGKAFVKIVLPGRPSVEAEALKSNFSLNPERDQECAQEVQRYQATLTAQSAEAKRLRDEARATGLNGTSRDKETNGLSDQNANILSNLIFVNKAYSASALYRAGFLDAAEKEARRILEMADHRNVPDDIVTAQVLDKVSDILISEEKFSAAQAYLRRLSSIPAANSESGGDFAFGARAKMVIILANQHRNSEAASVALDLPREAQTRHNPEFLRVANLAVVKALFAEKKYEAAAPYVQAADDAVTALKLPPERHEQTELTMASIFYQEGRFAEAETIQTKWIQTDERNADVVNGRLPDAFFGDIAAAKAASGGFNTAALASDDAFVAYAANLRWLAATLLAERRYAESVQLLERALQINKRQIEVGIQGEREFHTGIAQENQSAAAGILAEALWGQAKTSASSKANADEAAAFTAAQTATDNPAAVALARSGAQTVGASKGLAGKLERRDELRQKLADLDQRDMAANVAGGSGGYENQLALNSEINKVAGEYRAVDDDLHKEFPTYWDLVSPKPIALAELQDLRLLHQNEALIFFLITPGREKGLVFAVSHDRAAWAQLGFSGDELAARVNRLREEIDPAGYGLRSAQRTDATGAPARGFERQAAYDLYQGLLGEASIQAVLSQKPVLIFVPSGPLTSLPPGLLVTSPPTGGIAGDTDPQALRATPWLLRSKAIAVLPSVSSLRTLRQLLPPVAATAQDRLLAFADPDFGGSAEAGPRGAQIPRGLEGYFRDKAPNLDALRQLPALPGTRVEAEALRTALQAGPNSVLTGASASKAELMARNADGRLMKVGVLEFATHALVSGDLSGLGEPALVLAAGPKPEDTLLLASEAARLKLGSEWVLLSACNTASPDSPDAQGLSGLSRAFFYAGAHALLVSHWRVRDDIAAKLVPAVLIKEDSDPSLGHAEAVRRASLAVLDDPNLNATSPAAWAPFTLVGEPER
jgi:CHAT domain-containing protein